MPIKKTVFGSRTERENFYKLSRQWGDRYRIWHNLPFLNVIDVNRYADWQTLVVRELSPIEFNRLKKTSIDYVLCEEDGDRPILGIEFDGMNEGYNVGTRYVSEPPPDPGRAGMMELKLKVAHGNYFPFFVLGSKHFADLGEVKLTIVDGIIGEVLTRGCSGAIRGWVHAERCRVGR